GAEARDRVARQMCRIEQSGARGVVDVVVDVRDEIGDAHDLTFDRARAHLLGHADRRTRFALRMLRDPVADFPGQVQAAAVVLEYVDDAQALLVMVEAAGHQAVDDALAGVAERRVPQIVAERNRFGQLFVQPQHLRDRPRDLRDLERVGQARAVVIAGRGEEHLRFVLQAAEGLAVNDAVAIALKCGPDVVFALGSKSPAGISALGRARHEHLALARLELFAKTRHAYMMSRRKLVPCGRRPTLKISASVCPTSANVRRVPRSTPRRTWGPAAKSGTYSRA